MNSIFTRRSIRRYTDEYVADEKIEKILRAGMQSPSAASQKPWEFLVIRDKDRLQQLSRMNPYASSIASSSATIIIFGNTDRMILPPYWQQDLGACTQNMLLEVTELGLGSVWIGLAPDEKYLDFVNEMFDVPSNMKAYSIIPIGYPAENQSNKFVDRYDESRIHKETF